MVAALSVSPISFLAIITIISLKASAIYCKTKLLETSSFVLVIFISRVLLESFTHATVALVVLFFGQKANSFCILETKSHSFLSFCHGLPPCYFFPSFCTSVENVACAALGVRGNLIPLIQAKNSSDFVVFHYIRRFGCGLHYKLLPAFYLTPTQVRNLPVQTFQNLP